MLSNNQESSLAEGGEMLVFKCKSLKAHVFWKRHSDVVILLRCAKITVQVWFVCD